MEQLQQAIQKLMQNKQQSRIAIGAAAVFVIIVILLILSGGGGDSDTTAETVDNNQSTTNQSNNTSGGSNSGTVQTTRVGTIDLGRQVSGQLAERQRAIHTVRVESGTTITITLQSSDFDAYLRLNNGSFELATDDDSAGSRNARITFTLDSFGDYDIIVGSVSDNGAGSYTLSVE